MPTPGGRLGILELLRARCRRGSADNHCVEGHAQRCAKDRQVHAPESCEGGASAAGNKARKFMEAQPRKATVGRTSGTHVEEHAAPCERRDQKVSTGVIHVPSTATSVVPSPPTSRERERDNEKQDKERWREGGGEIESERERDGWMNMRGERWIAREGEGWKEGGR